MLTNIFVNNRKLHKFATTNSNFKKNIDYFRNASSHNVHVYQFGLVDHFKLCTQNLSANNRKLQKFTTCNLNFEKSLLSYTNHSNSHIKADFKINRLCRSVRTTFQSYFYRRRTDGQTDRRTDGRTDGRTDIASDNTR